MNKTSKQVPMQSDWFFNQSLFWRFVLTTESLENPFFSFLSDESLFWRFIELKIHIETGFHCTQ